MNEHWTDYVYPGIPGIYREAGIPPLDEIQLLGLGQPCIDLLDSAAQSPTWEGALAAIALLDQRLLDPEETIGRRAAYAALPALNTWARRLRNHLVEQLGLDVLDPLPT